jgi:hypothetical protein
VAARRRGPLGGLFLLLTCIFAGVAAYAGTAGQWLLTACAGVLGLWMGDLAVRHLR